MTVTGGLPVAGVVLAAGRSERMGRPKSLLEVDGETLVERAVATLAGGGCDPVIAVVAGGEAGEGTAARAAAAGARAVENPDPGSEQVDSLAIGLDAVGPGVAAAVVLPVDFPAVGPAVVARLIAVFRRAGAPIVRPVHGDRPGHPVLFARDVWAEFSEPDLEEGARDVVHRHREEIAEVPVDEEGVAFDVDTPEEWESRGRGA